MVTVTLTQIFERQGTIHRPGDSITAPLDEAASLIRLGFALPHGAPVEIDRRPIRGTFIKAPSWHRR